MEILISAIVFLLLCAAYIYGGYRLFSWIMNQPEGKRLFRMLGAGIIATIAMALIYYSWIWTSRAAITAVRQANAQLTAGAGAAESMWVNIDYSITAIVMVLLAWGLIAIARHYASLLISKIIPTTGIERSVGEWIVNVIAVLFISLTLTETFKLPDGSASLFLIAIAIISAVVYLVDWWFPNGQNKIGVSVSYIICCLSTSIIANNFGWNAMKSVGGINGMTLGILFNALIFFFFIGLGDPSITLWKRKGFRFVIVPWMFCLMVFSGYFFWLQTSGQMTWVERKVAQASTIANQDVELLERKISAQGTDKLLSSLQDAVKTGDLEQARIIRDELNMKHLDQRLVSRANITKPLAIENVEVFIGKTLSKVNTSLYTHRDIQKNNGEVVSTILINKPGMMEFDIYANSGNNKFAIKKSLYYRFEEVSGDFDAIYSDGTVVRVKSTGSGKKAELPALSSFEIIPVNGKTWVSLRVEDSPSKFF